MKLMTPKPLNGGLRDLSVLDYDLLEVRGCCKFLLSGLKPLPIAIGIGGLGVGSQGNRKRIMNQPLSSITDLGANRILYCAFKKMIGYINV